ncbi:uncharacterized protein LOC116350163, partial [Contarinia nasturtii]|uniref:uncharacterized protein LOC116350163 n=1 Tax=Contarinia nasturtii TaxID=265458 RepID=UPI0012D3F292
MNQVFAVFHLTQAKQTVVGRIDWIYKLNLAKTLNNRINRNQTQIVFWSKNLEKNPSFNTSTVRLREEFNPNEDAIYRAKIVKCFETKNGALQHLRYFRCGAPALYNSERLQEKPLPPTFPINCGNNTLQPVQSVTPCVTVVRCHSTSSIDSTTVTQRNDLNDSDFNYDSDNFYYDGDDEIYEDEDDII